MEKWKIQQRKFEIPTQRFLFLHPHNSLRNSDVSIFFVINFYFHKIIVKNKSHSCSQWKIFTKQNIENHLFIFTFKLNNYFPFSNEWLKKKIKNCKLEDRKSKFFEIWKFFIVKVIGTFLFLYIGIVD